MSESLIGASAFGEVREKGNSVEETELKSGVSRVLVDVEGREPFLFERKGEGWTFTSGSNVSAEAWQVGSRVVEEVRYTRYDRQEGHVGELERGKIGVGKRLDVNDSSIGIVESIHVM